MKKKCKFTIILESSQLRESSLVRESSVTREDEYLLDDDAISIVEEILASIATSQYVIDTLQRGKNAPKLKFRLDRI